MVAYVTEMWFDLFAMKKMLVFLLFVITPRVQTGNMHIFPIMTLNNIYNTPLERPILYETTMYLFGCSNIYLFSPDMDLL